MNDTSRLFPVYEKDSDTSVFFIPPDVLPPTPVDYYKEDIYQRGNHLTQFLALPLYVPNYLALCGTSEQRAWEVTDQVDPHSFRVNHLLVVLKVKEVEHVLFINTYGYSNNAFIRAPIDESQFMLNMILRARGGFSFETYHNEIDKTLFGDFKTAGYEPVFNIRLAGTFDRQRETLVLKDPGSELIGVRNLESGVFIPAREASQPILELMKTVDQIFIGGVKLYQSLK